MKELSSQNLSTDEQEIVLSERLTQADRLLEMADSRIFGEQKASLSDHIYTNQQQHARRLITKKKN